MEQVIPSHTTSANSPDLTQAHTYARAIRAALESLDDLRNARARCVESARQRANTDDIKPRLVREAAGLARWVEVKPAMFEDTMEEEMGKFDRYKESVEEGREKQEELLAQVEVSRSDCSSMLQLELIPMPAATKRPPHSSAYG
jgi:programmed cell death 6-interacting protein